MCKHRSRVFIAVWSVIFSQTLVAQARQWTDSSGQYTLEADLVALDESRVVLKRDDHELVALALEELSEPDREYLKSEEAGDLARETSEALQTWTLRDGTTMQGRIVDYARRDLTLQRRRGRIYVNDRRFENLPKFYQALIPKIVAQAEDLQRANRQALESWLVRQRGEPRTMHLEGIVVELENGDEYGVPFFLLSEDDLQLLQAGWQRWLAANDESDYRASEEHAFLLRSLAAAHQRDRQVQREIARMQLKLQAVQAGMTSLWEVTLYPAVGNGGPPRWIVVPGRDSRQATQAALEQSPGFVAGRVRRVSRI